MIASPTLPPPFSSSQRDVFLWMPCLWLPARCFCFGFFCFTHAVKRSERELSLEHALHQAARPRSCRELFPAIVSLRRMDSDDEMSGPLSCPGVPSPSLFDRTFTLFPQPPRCLTSGSPSASPFENHFLPHLGRIFFFFSSADEISVLPARTLLPFWETL